MEQIKSLKELSIDDLYESFQNAFADYEMQLSKAQLQAMLLRRGYNQEISFGAFQNNKLIAFTFNGVGEFNGNSTAYDTGTGTVKEHRGKGLARKIFLYSIPYLQKAGISQYLLEVLQHNKGAFSLYQKLGFNITREFYYYVVDVSEIKLYEKPIDKTYIIVRDIALSRDMAMKFWDFHPSWQNSFDSVYRQKDNFRIVGAYKNKILTGYAIFEPSSGDITQLAVDKQHRRKGIATKLINEVLKINETSTLKIINSTIYCNSLYEFLKTNSIKPTGKQYEMIKKI